MNSNSALTLAAASPEKVSLTALMAAQLASETALADGASQMAADLDVPGTGTAVKAPKSAKEGAKAKPGKSTVTMERFGLTDEAQWLLITPSRWEDCKTFTDDFGNLYQGNVALVRAKVTSKMLYDDRGKVTTDPRFAVRLDAYVTNRLGQGLTVTAFGKPGFGWKGYEKGSEIVLRGVPRIGSYSQEMELSQVEVVRAGDIGKIFPVYPPVNGTKGAKFAEKVLAHRHLMPQASDLLTRASGWNEPRIAEALIEHTQFDSAASLLRELHTPSSVAMAQKARIGANLLSAWSLIRTTSQRVNAVQIDPTSIIDIDQAVVDALKRRVPFHLTRDQHHAIDGICRSLRSPMPMTGLLSGDVGSGKTLSFLLPMVATHLAGKKSMLMTPNLLLVKQVAKELATLFPEIPVCTVTGNGIVGKPESSIVIGTSALLGAMKKGKLGSKPSFFVCDEQHKFSVAQREQLIDGHTNSLEATATPMPRTAALATHGAKDMFLLHEIPVEKTVVSRIMGRALARQARNEVLEAVINRGEQAAVIYPIVETEDPEKMLQSVAEAASNWSRKVPMEDIAVLHGRLKDEEKSAVLDAFRNGQKKLLLSSTVIEVGVTLPELKTMLVLGAENFGVVTLHQLRGRLARNGGHGNFVMFTESQEPEALNRLGLLEKFQDGFVLAEKDAELRGYGDILGLEGDTQSGKTRTIFLGVNINHEHISFAANLHDKLQRIEQAHIAADVVKMDSKKHDAARIG